VIFESAGRLWVAARDWEVNVVLVALQTVNGKQEIEGAMAVCYGIRGMGMAKMFPI